VPEDWIDSADGNSLALHPSQEFCDSHQPLPLLPMESNPYATPSANLYGTTGAGADSVSEGTLRHLQGTKPWVQFMSVLFFILAGLMFLGGIAMGLMGGVSGMAMAEGGEPAAGIAGAMGIVMAVIYCTLGLLYLFPAVKMWKYGSRIGTLAQTRSVADLEGALNEQRVVWKFWGIMTIIGIVLGMGGAIVAGVAGAMAASAAAGGGL
jgi:hypothetical protein